MTDLIFYIMLVAIVYFIVIGIPVIIGRVTDKRVIDSHRKEEYVIQYNGFMKGLMGVGFILFTFGTVLCGVQVLEGKEDVSVFLLWLFVFTLPTGFVFLTTLLQKLSFVDDVVIYRNLFGFCKKYAIEELEIYSFKKNIYAYKNGKKVFSICDDATQTVKTGHNKGKYLKKIHSINSNIAKLSKTLNLLEKPYVLKLIKFGKVQTCTEDKVVFFIMLGIGIAGGIMLLLWAKPLKAIILLDTFILLYCLMIFDYISKTITMSYEEDEFTVSKFYVLKKKYRYSDIEIKIKGNWNGFQIYEIKKGFWKIMQFSEKDPNIEDFYFTWKKFKSKISR